MVTKERGTAQQLCAGISDDYQGMCSPAPHRRFNIHWRGEPARFTQFQFKRQTALTCEIVSHHEPHFKEASFRADEAVPMFAED